MRISDWSSDVFSSVLVDDRGIVFIHGDLFCGSEIAQVSILKLKASFLGNDGTTCQDGKVFQHCFATVSKTRSLYSGNFQGAAQLVHNKRSQSFPVNVLRSEVHTSELQSLMRISY